MPHETALIATIAAGLGLAFVFGFIATRMSLPPLVGYLLAGIAVGPFTPGYVADAGLASQLAEIGVILLMFGVGLHFSIGDLLEVRRIAVPGAITQIVVATLLGAAVSQLWGWTWGEGLVFGLALSVASTVVLLRALEERGALDSVNGRIAVGWLIVEDLVTVLALVLLPALALPLGGTDAAPGAEVATVNIWGSLLLTLAKVTAFVAIMLFVGRRAVPWLLDRVARTGSRELFTLGVLAVALGIAVGAAALFGVSFALGAFFAGVVISESDLSHQAAADALPLQDAFAVLFFVSVGMLFDPAIVLERPVALLGTVLIVIFGKSAAAFAIVLLFRYPLRTALMVSASLAQIGEFSFILAGLGLSLGLLPPEGQSLILATAIISITLNPLIVGATGAVEGWIQARPRMLDMLERPPGDLVELPAHVDHETLRDHVVIIGFGRVGGTIGRALERQGVPYIVVERNREAVEALRKRGLPVLYGDATRPGILKHAHLERASTLVIAAPGAYHGRQIIEIARAANRDIDIVARTHSEAEQRYLEKQGVSMAVMGERELALGMTRYALRSRGVDPDQVDFIIQAIRTRGETAPRGVTVVEPTIGEPSAEHGS
jgi:CPA2 family monovalent cation:H+ antiporter-2